MDAIPAAAAPLPAAADPRGRAAALEAAATEFEAVFLAEMLRHAGLGEARQGPGAGAGQDSFGAMLADEYARAIAEAGGTGLADQVRRALEARAGR